MTAGTPFLMILLLELCELKGTLDSVEKEENEVFTFFGGCEEPGCCALGGGGLVDFIGEGSSTAWSRLIVVGGDCCEERSEAKPLEAGLLSAVPFACFRGDRRGGVALPDLACEDRIGAGLAVSFFRGRPGRLLGDGASSRCLLLPLLRCVVGTFRGEQATTISSPSSVGLRLLGTVKGLKKSLMFLPCFAGIATCDRAFPPPRSVSQASRWTSTR